MALRDNMVSWWELNETSGTRNDSHGTNHLTDNNTVGSGVGKQGNAADFEAANGLEYFSITDAAQSGLDVGSTYSWAFWVKSESDANCFVCAKYATSQQSYAIQYGTSIEQIRFYNSSETTYDFPLTITNDVWNFIVLTYDSGTLTCYANGSAIGSPASVGTLTNTSAAFRIGSIEKYTGNLMDGLIDEFAVWSRVITTSEITELYNGGNGLTYAQTGASALVPSLASLGVGA